MDNLQQIIDFAIKKEEYANAMYKRHASLVENPAAKKLLNELAAEELVHKKKLQDLKKQPLSNQPIPKVADLKIANFLEDTQLAKDSNIQDTLTFAIREEKAAENAYKALSRTAKSAEFKTIFDTLAGEESKHARRLQELYDDIINTQN